MSLVNFKQEQPIEAAAFKVNNDMRETGTDSSQAITQNAIKGVVTSSTTNLAAATTEDITITNPNVTAESHISVQVSGGGAGDVVCGPVTPSDGSFVVTVLNADQSNACDAAYKIHYLILG